MTMEDFGPQIISDSDWDKLQRQCKFFPEKILIARNLLDLAIMEFVREERAPNPVAAVLGKISSGAHDLASILKNALSDNFTFDILLRDRRYETLDSFNERRNGSIQELNQLIDSLNKWAEWADNKMTLLPETHPGADSSNIERLVFCIDRIVGSCSSRSGLKRSRNNFNDAELVKRIFDIAFEGSRRLVNKGSIEAAMKAVISLRRSHEAHSTRKRTATKGKAKTIRLSPFFQSSIAKQMQEKLSRKASR